MIDIFGEAFRKECRGADSAIKKRLIETKLDELKALEGQILVVKNPAGKVIHLENLAMWCTRHGMQMSDFYVVGVDKINKIIDGETENFGTWEVSKDGEVDEAVNENKGVQYVKIKDLLPCPYNREIDPAKVENIKKAIMDSGVIKPFVVTEVNSDDGEQIMITDGHHRHLALKELIKDGEYKEDSEVPVVISNGKGTKSADGEAQKEVKEARNRRDKCMRCSAKPTKECLWAEGHGHAWFCDKCFGNFKKENEGEMCSVKAITDGEACKKYADNKNPVIKEAKKDPFDSVSDEDLGKRHDAEQKQHDDFYGMELRDQFVRNGHSFFLTDDDYGDTCDFCGEDSEYQSLYPDIDTDDEDDLEMAYACQACIDRLRLPYEVMDKDGKVTVMNKTLDEAQGVRDPFDSANPADVQARVDKAEEMAKEKVKHVYAKFIKIADILGFTEDVPDPGVTQSWRRKSVSHMKKKGNLILTLSTDPDYAPTRMSVEIENPNLEGWNNRRQSMYLSNKLKPETLAKKIGDDLLPRFATDPDEAWAAKFTPKARYKRYCGSCFEPIKTGTRHFRLSSGQTVCADCVRKTAGMLGEGKWISATRDLMLTEDLEGVSPDKQEWIRTGDEELNQIMPQLSQEEQQYLMTIASESYAETVARVQSATGIEVTSASLPSLFSLLMQTLNQTIDIEASNKNYLEELALSLIFSVPEFKLVEQEYMRNNIGFDIKLGKSELERLVAPQEESDNDELSEPEEINMDLADEWKGADETNIKRRFSNLIISGGSINKIHLFSMVMDNLERLDPHLPAYYGILASVAQIGYWLTPFGIEKGAAGAEGDAGAGSEEVIRDGDKFIIKARGLTFPYLVHEIVKGIYEYLAYNPEHESAFDREQVEDETKDMMAGPGVYKAVMSYIPNDKQEMMPLIQRKLTDLGAEEIRNILAKNQDGQQIMNNLLRTVEKEWEEYTQAHEE